MKTNVVFLSERLRLGDRFSVLKGNSFYTFQVMGMEINYKGHKHTYWVSQVTETGKKAA